jgi:hypothetical protein
MPFLHCCLAVKYLRQLLNSTPLFSIQVQPLIKNIQDNGVIANAKHYVNNNQVTSVPFLDGVACTPPGNIESPATLNILQYP